MSGGGTGMRAFGFKAGIGTASRVVSDWGRSFLPGGAGAGKFCQARRTS